MIFRCFLNFGKVKFDTKLRFPFSVNSIVFPVIYFNDFVVSFSCRAQGTLSTFLFWGNFSTCRWASDRACNQNDVWRLQFPFQHDHVLERKGPLGREWRTNDEPFNKEKTRRPSLKWRRTDRGRLATAGSSDWEELEVFFKLCRGERLRVSFPLRLSSILLLLLSWFSI